MFTPTAYEIKDLKKEVELLRSLVIGVVGKDPEGDYQPEFIERVFNLADKKPKHSFSNHASLLKQLNK